MTRRLEVGVGLEKKNVPMESGAVISRMGAIRCSIDSSWVRNCELLGVARAIADAHFVARDPSASLVG